MKLKKTVSVLKWFGIALFWLLVWEVAALAVGNLLLFPDPITVLKVLGRLLGEPLFYQVTGKSLWNVLVGILSALLVGVALAALTYRVRLIREFLFPLMAVMKATPVASFIVLTLIWIGSERVPTLITFLIVLPVVWTNLDEGLRRQSKELREMTQTYGMSPLRRLRYLTIPSVTPYFVSACRTAFGLAWKAGIAAEIIAMPRNSIGTMIGDAKQYLLTEEMFAWTLTVILLSLLIEFGFVSLLAKLDKRPKQEDLPC